MYRRLFLYSALVATPWLAAQDNRILVRDVLSAEVDTIAAAPFPDLVSDFMPSHTGTMPGVVSLPDLTAPIGFTGSSLMRPPHAVDTYTLTDYPVRAAGGLREVGGPFTGHRCSAQLVAPRFVLTAAHCVRTLQGDWLPGALEMMPVFDQGLPSALPSSRALRYYVPEQTSKDYALVELEDPIGAELGWVGLGYSMAPDHFEGRIVHKFSYPSDTSYLDPSLIYNGDTLYTLSTPMVRTSAGNTAFAGVTGWSAILGESGSGVWLADGDSYHVLGVLAFANGFRHMLLDPGTFHQFRVVIEGDAVSINDPEAVLPTVRIHPNPMRTQSTVELIGAAGQAYELRIMDLSGRTVRSINFIGASCTIDRGGLAPGTYVVCAGGSHGAKVTARLVVE